MSGLSISHGSSQITRVPATEVDFFSFSQAIHKKGDDAPVQFQKFKGPEKESSLASMKMATDLALRGLSQLRCPGATLTDFEACTRNYDEALKGVLRHVPTNSEKSKNLGLLREKITNTPAPSFAARDERPKILPQDGVAIAAGTALGTTAALKGAEIFSAKALERGVVLVGCLAAGTARVISTPLTLTFSSTALGNADLPMQFAETATQPAANKPRSHAHGKERASITLSRDGAQTTSAGTVHFPSQEKLLKCLSEHRLTNDPYYEENRINEAVAKFFANSTRDRDHLVNGIRGVLGELGLHPAALITMEMNITKALQDCAKSHPTPPNPDKVLASVAALGTQARTLDAEKPKNP